ncbi:hypothetical protein WJX77_012142 [Trebouxia sp. C0004]
MHTSTVGTREPGEEVDSREITAGHIYRHAWPTGLLNVMGCKLHEPRNIVLMQKQLEKRFDNWDWTIVPEGPDAFRVEHEDVGVIEDVEYTWAENKYEPQQQEKYLQALKNEVHLPKHFSWVQTAKDNPSLLKTTMSSGGAELPFPIGCKTDECIVIRRSATIPEASITCTVEVKRHVVKQSLRHLGKLQSAKRFAGTNKEAVADTIIEPDHNSATHELVAADY